MITIILGTTLILLAIGLFVFATPEEGKPSRFVKSRTLGAFMPVVVLCMGFGGFILLASALFR